MISTHPCQQPGAYFCIVTDHLLNNAVLKSNARHFSISQNDCYTIALFCCCLRISHLVVCTVV